MWLRRSVPASATVLNLSGLAGAELQSLVTATMSPPVAARGLSTADVMGTTITFALEKNARMSVVRGFFSDTSESLQQFSIGFANNCLTMRSAICTLSIVCCSLKLSLRIAVTQLLCLYRLFTQ